MPEALKHRLGPAAVRRIAAGLRQAWPAFPADAFEARCLDGGDDRELSARAVHIADTMRAMLPPDYREAVRVVIAALGPPVDPEAPNPDAFTWWPHACFVERHGLDEAHLDDSKAAHEAVTRRFTAEFALRPFLARHPDATWRWLHDWAGHDDVHLRRLASECTRARLPWARQVAALRHEPQRTLALLERLRDDPARYVQRSVANNLNDLSRDHPDRVLATCTRWWADGGDNRRWIVRHALRTLLKRGDPQALALLGAGAAPRLDLRQVSWQPQRPQVGGTLRLRWQLASTHDAPQALRVDLRLQPPDGVATRPRVFRVRTVTPLPPGGTLDQGLTLSFEPMTTRRHHPGVHRVWLQINGHDLPLGTFELAAAG
jgi:3-methyladenine DNA glycosylase AlkC